MAAPITTTTTSTRKARVLRIARVREHPTPEEVEDAFRVAQRNFRRDFREAVERELLADLETWPRAFREVLEPEIRNASSPSYMLTNFRQRRAAGTTSTPVDPADCGCGCRGFTDEVAKEIRAYREAAAQVAGTRGRPWLRRRRRAKLRNSAARERLLLTMWWTGVRRLDRAAMRAHFVESAEADARHSENAIEWSRERAREARARLKENRKHNRRGPTAEPLSRSQRLRFQLAIEELAPVETYERARLAHVRELLGDPFELARERTGCQKRLATGTRS